jgi:hypothetical protein
MSPAVLAWVEATRRRQGLPPRVEDPAVLDEIAAIATTNPAPATPVGEGGGDAAA